MNSSAAESYSVLLSCLDEAWDSLVFRLVAPWDIAWWLAPQDRFDYELYILERGSGTLTIGERSYEIGSGDIFLLASEEGNSFRPAGGAFRMLLVNFEFAGSAPETVKAKLNPALQSDTVIRSGVTYELLQIFSEMSRSFSFREERSEFIMKLLFGNMLCRCIEQLDAAKGAGSSGTGNGSTGGSRALISDAIDYMQSNFNRKIRLEDLGRHVGLHPRYLCTLFRQVTGETVTAYLQSLRMERAKRLLIYTPMSVTEIAYEVGFSSAQYFSKIFRRAEGTDPSGYRRQNRRRL